MDRRSRLTASILAGLAAISLWLSAGTLAVSGGDTLRIAAFPSFLWLAALIVAAVALARIVQLQLHEAFPLAISLLLWLPYLPFRVPPAFLLWQGSIVWFVWLLVGAGLVAARPPRLPRLFTEPKTAPWIAALLIGAASFVVFARVPDVIPGGDEPHYLAATQSLIKDFDLRVANNYANGDYLDYFPGQLEPHFLRRSKTGEIYSIHAPGVSVMVLPAFLAAGYTGAVLTMILFAALTAALTWRLCYRIASACPAEALSGGGAAWTGTLAVFLTAPYFFHTFTIYPEIIGSFCVMCGAWLLLEFDDGRDVDMRSLIAVSAALATLPWLHSRFAVIAALIGVFVIARLMPKPNAVRRIAAFVTLPAIAALAWFAYFWAIWGSPSPAAPYGADTSTSASYVLRGLIGLLVDQQFGVLFTAPIYLAAIPGVVRLARTRRRLTIEATIVVIAYAVAVASYAMWWAGSAAPARFLVAILPLAAPVIALTAGTLSTIGVMASVALILPRAFVEGGRLIFNSRNTFDPTIEWLSRVVDLSMALPSVHRDGGWIAMRDASAWLILIAAAAWAMSRLRQRGAITWAAGGLALAASLLTAVSIVWSWHGAAAATPDRAKLASFARLRSWHRTFVNVSGARALGQSDFLEALSIQVPGGTARLNRLPAGEYHVSTSDGVTTRLSRNDQAINLVGDRWRLPVMLQSPVFQDTGLTLTPAAVVKPAINRNAVHAAQYGDATVFFFDEQAYAERDGFWTRGNGDAAVVVDRSATPAATALQVSVRAGAVPTTITLSSNGWRQTLTLAAGQNQDVTVPLAPDNVWPLTIRSGPGFRPSQREPGNRDVRLLAAWIEIR